MFRARRRSAFIPPLVVMGTAVLLSIATSPLALAAPGTLLPACGSGPAAVATAASSTTAGSPPVTTEMLDADGQFIGRSLSVNAAGRSLSVVLPAESSIGQPVGNALVYSFAREGRSEIRVVDLVTACDLLTFEPVNIVRSAILDPSGTSVYVHSVTDPAREDAGVMRYGLDGYSSAVVVPPLAPDIRFGPTFGTQLGWSTDDSTLFVQSCGLDQCRTRLLDGASGTISTYDAAGQGPVVELTAQHLVTYANCAGLPCDVLSMDRSSGVQVTLASDASSASAAFTAGSPVVRIETAAGIVEVTQ